MDELLVHEITKITMRNRRISCCDYETESYKIEKEGGFTTRYPNIKGGNWTFSLGRPWWTELCLRVSIKDRRRRSDNSWFISKKRTMNNTTTDFKNQDPKQGTAPIDNNLTTLDSRFNQTLRNVQGYARVPRFLLCKLASLSHLILFTFSKNNADILEFLVFETNYNSSMVS